MSSIRVYADQAPQEALQQSNDHATIAGILDQAGVRFERWAASQPVAPGASQDEVISAYRADIDRLINEEGYQTVDVVSLNSDHPDKAALRQKFLDEHRHGEDEVRFFVAGAGLFSLHIGDKVYEVLCEQGDLISVPANTPHWFDMGPNPHFVAIRLFNNPDGWVAHFTGSDIAGRFNRLEN
ncbi:ARD/ARD' family protein [Isoalcanivorax pacificus W11-5]|jgi:1,2-dihydroxy-3-keto-5-methylthiopentene dioxygenase|uniref:Acireductone dioxygenase n=1 Tax=Isoalcanivorax pacificus W11-5 TaxID=391936 RepID=A0A0B4XNJ2_9GAMM|nr:acireductone dioxygenase [Isoalcanivorax pacificus]AJD48345.1 ARD/ARD' family protein [Isoalcanivorax pacificus W11-5]